LCRFSWNRKFSSTSKAKKRRQVGISFTTNGNSEKSFEGQGTWFWWVGCLFRDLDDLTLLRAEILQTFYQSEESEHQYHDGLGCVGETIHRLVLLFELQCKSPRRGVVRIPRPGKKTLQTAVSRGFPICRRFSPHGSEAADEIPVSFFVSHGRCISTAFHGLRFTASAHVTVVF
jgi:hypothetical protein